jgi:hypothetical protein
VAFRTGDIQRAGQIIHHGVHERLHALFLERGTAQHGNQFNLAGEPADGRLERRRGDRLFFETRFGDLVVLVGDGVNQFRERGLGAFLDARREFPDLVIQTFVGLARSPIRWPSG